MSVSGPWQARNETAAQSARPNAHESGAKRFLPFREKKT